MSPGYRKNSNSPGPFPSKRQWMVGAAMAVPLGLVGIASPATAVAQDQERPAGQRAASLSDGDNCTNGLAGIPGLLSALLGAGRGCTTGPPGSSGVTGAQMIRSDFREVTPGQTADIFVFCPEGQVATGGGFEVRDSQQGRIRVTGSGPLSTTGTGQPTQWLVSVINEGEDNSNVAAWVVCVDSAP
jgi:hypothetical protein